jgi:hypothetical protein
VAAGEGVAEAVLLFAGLLFETFAGWLATQPQSIIVRAAMMIAALGKVFMQGLLLL